MQVFRRAGDNLLNLINDILDLSKVEPSQLELERTGFSLRDLLEKVTEMVVARAQEKQLTLVCETEPKVPNELVGDPTRLQQVLLNLLGNAIKFTESGQVALRVTYDEGPTSLRFSISDTGVGIPIEKLCRVFERFTQADSSTTRRFGGSGLGLTISKRLVELMGGRIWVESEVAVGSVFSFAVPFEICAAATATRRSAEPDGAGPVSPLPALRILLVEDSPDNCMIAVAYLADTPYQVEIAATGAIACEMFADGHYDLVLMDRQMPVMDGLTATRNIRAWEEANGKQSTPIIALTASALKGDRELCMSAGCTAFLTKPIKQEVLLQAIKEHSLVIPPLLKKVRIYKDPILRHANHIMAAQIPQFLLDRRQDVLTLLAALAQSDFETVKHLGHCMHGSGDSFGFQAITDIGADIEQDAALDNMVATHKWVNELSTYLDRVGLSQTKGFEQETEVPLRRALTETLQVLAGSDVLKIVLVEDNEPLRTMFHEFLALSGHHVMEARDGTEGLSMILAEKPDVAILDIGLPGAMDGCEVARKVRAALGASLLLIAMTGRGDESDRLEAIAAGFNTHMTKPVDLEFVLQMIETNLRSPVCLH